MKRTKPPKNSAKQILKLFKHFYDPLERWWETPLIDGSSLSQKQWEQGSNSLLQISSVPREEWDEEELFSAVKLTNTSLYSAFKKKKMQDYRDWYQPMIEQGIKEALDDSQETGRYFLGRPEFAFHFKTLTSVKISERKAPVLSDCYISRSGIVIFLKTKTFFSTRGRFPKEIRSAYRSGYAPLRNSRIRMAWYYRDKSEHNRVLFSFAQRTTEGGPQDRVEGYARYLLGESSSRERAILLAGLGALLQKWEKENLLLREIWSYIEPFKEEVGDTIQQRWFDFGEEINQRLQRGVWFDLIFHSYFIELGAIEFFALHEQVNSELLLQQVGEKWIVLAPFSRTLRRIYPLTQGGLQASILKKIDAI